MDEVFCLLGFVPAGFFALGVYLSLSLLSVTWNRYDGCCQD